MIIPLGERFHQDIYLLEKKDGKLVRKHLMPTLFVPMTGRSEKERRQARPAPSADRQRRLRGPGRFRRRTGWHYHREMTLVSESPPEGRHFARFENEDRGRFAQALQGLAIDGHHLTTLDFRAPSAAKTSSRA